MKGRRDGLQIFNLTIKANTIKQDKDPIEIYYGKIITIWKEMIEGRFNFEMHKKHNIQQ